MIYTLRNEKVSADIDAGGASAVSFRTADGKFDVFANGGAVTPVFPFCGRLYGDKYLYDGEFYPVPPNGVLREREFTLEEQSKDRLVMSASYDDATLSGYPFKFTVETVYSLENTALTVSYNVKNEGTRKLIYSIGSDVCFGVPRDGGARLRFDGKAELTELLCGKDGLLTGESSAFRSEGDDISEALLKAPGRSHILAGKFPPAVWESGGGEARVSYNDFKFTYLCAEKTPKGAFIRLSPRTGIPSGEGRPDNIRTKKEMNVCDAGKKQIFLLSIEINT